MDIKNCLMCNIKPEIHTDELGMTYWFICTKCGKHTQDILCPSSTLDNPHYDDNTIQRLTKEWNDMN